MLSALSSNYDLRIVRLNATPIRIIEAENNIAVI